MRGTLCGKANRGRVKAVFFLLAVIISLLVGLNLGGCVPAPRNYGEAESVGYQGIVLTDHPQIRNKLRSIAGTFDESNFADNLVAVYDYVKSLPYYYDSEKHGVGDFWQTGPETIEAGGGDCEDHAILLVTLIEALYRETYGTIPQNLVWVVAGIVEEENLHEHLPERV